MPVSTWQKVTAVAAVLLVLELGGLALGFFVRAQLAEPRPRTQYVPQNCRATATTFSCSFTNTADTAATGVCVKGKLEPKSGESSDIGATLCSGVIGPRETKSLEVPLEGKAAGVCHDANGLLDFGACTLAVDPI